MSLKDFTLNSGAKTADREQGEHTVVFAAPRWLFGAWDSGG